MVDLVKPVSGNLGLDVSADPTPRQRWQRQHNRQKHHNGAKNRDNQAPEREKDAQTKAARPPPACPAPVRIVDRAVIPSSNLAAHSQNELGMLHPLPARYVADCYRPVPVTHPTIKQDA